MFQKYEYTPCFLKYQCKSFRQGKTGTKGSNDSQHGGEHFIGAWRSDKSENWDELLKKAGQDCILWLFSFDENI